LEIVVRFVATREGPIHAAAGLGQGLVPHRRADSESEKQAALFWRNLRIVALPAPGHYMRIHGIVLLFWDNDVMDLKTQEGVELSSNN
jgi:hypothetical protein